MSAPTHEVPDTEPPTLPLPIGERTALDLPPGHGCFKESGLWLFPGGPLAAVAVGVPLREFVLTTEELRFEFAVTALVLVFAICVGVFLLARLVNSEDTNAISLWRED